MAYSSMANALAASLAPPAQESVGARILKKMGWRLGQGIGPRITFQQRRAQDRVTGTVVPDEEAEDEEAKKHMFPRRDTLLLLVPRKDNSHGLGYTPGMSLNESLGGRGAAETKGLRIASSLP
jgi:G patch domain-containing protein 1